MVTVTTVTPAEIPAGIAEARGLLDFAVKEFATSRARPTWRKIGAVATRRKNKIIIWIKC